MLPVGFCLVLTSASQGTAGPFLDEEAELWHWVAHLGVTRQPCNRAGARVHPS